MSQSVSWFSFGFTILLNVISIAYFMGRLTNRIETEKELIMKTIESTEQQCMIKFSYIEKNNDDLRVVLGEIRKTNDRLGSEIDRLLGKLSNQGQ